jgi:hypothetical protein
MMKEKLLTGIPIRYGRGGRDAGKGDVGEEGGDGKTEKGREE